MVYRKIAITVTTEEPRPTACPTLHIATFVVLTKSYSSHHNLYSCAAALTLTSAQHEVIELRCIYTYRSVPVLPIPLTNRLTKRVTRTDTTRAVREMRTTGSFKNRSNSLSPAYQRSSITNAADAHIRLSKRQQKGSLVAAKELTCSAWQCTHLMLLPCPSKAARPPPGRLQPHSHARDLRICMRICTYSSQVCTCMRAHLSNLSLRHCAYKGKHGYALLTAVHGSCITCKPPVFLFRQALELVVDDCQPALSACWYSLHFPTVRELFFRRC